MSGAARIDFCRSVLFRVRSFPFGGVSLFSFEKVLRGIDFVERAVVPDNTAATFVAVHSFLFPAVAAADGSETVLYL